MSSLKLKGSTSGDITITVPAQAGTNTVTIPAVTGTLPLSNLDHVTNRPNSKPIIINGDMAVSQRGTSVASITSSGYRAVDRHRIGVIGVGTWTFSQSTTVPTGQGFATSHKFDCTTANGSLGATAILTHQTKLEGQDLQAFKKGTSNAEYMTLAFWVRSNKTGTYVVELYDDDNDRHISKTYTISSADTWEKKVLAFPGDTTGAFANDNGDSFHIRLHVAGGSNHTSGTLATSWASFTAANSMPGQTVNLADSTSNEWYVTGIQLEVGEYDSTTIPPFQHESFGDNLSRCQRYYQRWNGDSAYNTGMVGVYNDTTTLICIHTHIVPMRTAATFSISAASDFDLEPFDAAPSQVSVFGTGNEYQQAIDATDTSARTKGFGGVICCDQTDGFFDFDAEL